MTDPPAQACLPAEACLPARLRALIAELLAERPAALRRGVSVDAVAARLPELPYATVKAALRALADRTAGIRYVESLG